MKTVLYLHGQGGSAAEVDHYRPLFRNCRAVGVDYASQTPWDAKAELPAVVDALEPDSRSTVLIANSIGAFFAMHALQAYAWEKTFFISPIVDMEGLIRDMMARAGVSEAELRHRRHIPIGDGRTLSWDYWQYVQAHPVDWNAPTCILYGENDGFTSYQAMAGFARRTGAALTVMPGGEHWFHTPEQMAFLDEWIRRSL